MEAIDACRCTQLGMFSQSRGLIKADNGATITMAVEDVKGVDDHDGRVPGKLQMLSRLEYCRVLVWFYGVRSRQGEEQQPGGRLDDDDQDEVKAI